MSDDYIRDLPERPSVDVRKFDWPGPVAKAFGQDWTSPIAAIMGPQGGGKTTTCCMKIINAAARMTPCADGVRRSRWLVVRDTYDRLYRSAVASWLSLVPKSAGDWEGGQGRPAKHLVRWDLASGGRIELEMNFIAIGDQTAEDVMRGFEFSGLWINEGDRVTEDVLTYGVGRGLRYPAKSMLMPGRPEPRLQVIIDLNAPDLDSWFYRRFVDDPQPGHKLYRQPGGRSPQAENLQNLPGGAEYYARQISANASRLDWIRRMVDNEFGYSRHGEPVFPEFSDQRHVAPQPLQFLPNLPVIVGLDAGLHPAALFRQQTPAGQVRWVAELYFGRMGSTRFGEMAQRFIAEKIPQNCRLTGYADPSAGDGADKEGGELSWIETIQHALGFPILQAPSNELPLRLDAVRQPLTTLIEGEPGFVLSPACRVARRGFNSGYHFVRVRNSNGEFHRDVPNKQAEESHIMDAGQYAELGARGRYGVIHNDRPGYIGAPARTVVPQMRVKL